MYFANDRDFYPTPARVIDEMMQGEDVANKVVLEPSAGSGNIVRWCEQHHARQILAVEPVDILRDMLARTSADLIGSDFLKITPAEVSHVDYIIMNPPFTRDEEHLQHAWAVAPAGCTIVAIMPTSTFTNAWSEKRKELADLVGLHGMRRDIGDAFNQGDAERRTAFPVSVVKLYKDGKGENEFKDYFFAKHDDDAPTGGAVGLMTYDAVRDLVNRYKMAVEQYDIVMQQADYINQLTNFAQVLTPEKRKSTPYERTSPSSIAFGAHWRGSERESRQTITREVFKRQLQKDAWRFVFSLMDLNHMATHKLQEQINQFIEEQTAVPFTMRNIYRMLEIVVKTNGQRMDSCLTDAFDIICSFSAENSTAGEKWKTNSNYMINRRFILPYIGRYDSRWPTDVASVETYGYTVKMDDVIKALCCLTGEPYNDKYYSVGAEFNDKRVAWGEWVNVGQFFRCRVYKKGTAHFEFLSDEVWASFNARVAQLRGWRLGSCTSKSSKKRR